MKNFNLIKRLWKTDSHEKQSPQRFARYAVMLIMLLTLGVGQMWADPWVCRSTAGGKIATKTVGDKLNGGNEWNYTYTTNGGWSGSGDFVKVYVGTSTSSYTSVSASWVSDDGSNKNVKANIGNVTFDKSGLWYAVGVYKSGGTTAYTTTNSTWTNNTTFSMGSNSEPYWQVNPPAVSDFTVTPSGEGYVSGSGTEDDPYIMNCAGGNMTLTLSGSKAKTDANSRLEYKSGTNAWNTTTTRTVNSISATTTAASLTLKMRCYNTSASLSGTESSTTIWYKKEESGSVSVSVTPSAGGSASRTPTTMGYYSGGTITATANTGYNFTRWDVTTGSGTIGSATTASTTFKPSTSSANVRATFTAKNYTIKLSKNGGDSDGTVTTTYNSTSTASFTGATYAGHSCDGYFTAKSGGSKIVNADGTLASGSVASYLSSGNWIGDTVTILYAQWTEDVTTYTVNYGVYSSHTSYGSLSCATTVGGSSITSGDEVASGTGVTFTASPISGYEVDAWYRNSGCTSLITEAGYASTFTPTITKDTTVYVKFKKKIYTITYSPSSAPTGCTYTTMPTTGTYGNTVTMVITPSTGYTVSVSAVDASSNTVTLTKSTNTYTFTQPASAVTVTVSTSQIMSTLSTSISYDGANPSYANPTKSVSSIGIATTATVTATAAGTGYTFAGWTLTNCTRTDGGGATANPITVRSNGDGAAATVVANYTEDLTSTWYVEGDASGPFLGWKADATTMLQKKTGYSTGNDVYWTATVTAGQASPSDTQWEFKIYNSAGANETAKWYGWGTDDKYYWLTNENNSLTLSNSTNNVRFKPYLAGDYEFHFNTSTKVLTVTWPVFNQVRISAASPSDATNTNNFDLSAPVSNVRSKTLSLNAGTTYTFKIVYDSEWYGYDSGTFTRNSSTSSNSRTISKSSGNMTLTTDYAGDYTFKFNQSTKALSVDFPAAYKITFGKGSVDGTTGSFSAVDLDNGNSAVTSNSTWVKSGDDVKITAPDAKSGYRFLGWYDNNSATGDAITTNANCTISVTAATTVYACYAENLTSITVSAGTGGTVTTGSGTSNLGVTTTKAINASANPGYTWSTWTISGTAALGMTATTASNTAKGDGTNGSTGTITATFTPNPYTITLKKHNGQSDGSINVTFDANTNLTGTAVTAPTKTGYTFGGYYTGESGAGTKIINADGTVVASASYASYTYTDASKNWKYPNNITLHAKWTAKTYTVTLDYDETNHGDITTTTPTGSVTATYAAEMPEISVLPKAAEGYAFMGYFSSAGGSGTQYYDGTGASVTNWNVDDEITLYAYYKKAEITAITLDATTVESEGTVSFTVTVSPTPTGTTKTCFTVLHSNDNPLAEQPTVTYSAGKYSFTAPAASGTYKIQAVLRTGSSCDGGDELDTEEANFQVAGLHSVTVRYKCGDEVIKSATTLEGIRPLDWSDKITAPEIFGYTFSSWTAGDGVTISTDGTDPIDGSTTSTSDIYIKAIYDGYLTANYNQNAIIYFKNTLGWENVFVNFHTGNAWNNDDNGSGSPKGVGNSGLTNRNKHMIQIGESDIYYYDYGAESISPTLYISFTDKSRDGVSEFWAENPGINVSYPANYPDAISTNKSSENGFKAATPMFVPLESQDAKPINVSNTGKANYYNAGYWTKYTPGTGYTLEIYNSEGNSFIKSVEFTSEDELMPMKAVVDLEAGQTYKYQLRRGGTDSYGIYYGNSGTMTYANHGSPTPWDMTNGSFSMCGITTNAAGDYTFNLSYSGNSSTPPHYRLRMAVDYPIASGDYRLVYTDNKPTCKPSAIIPKVNNGKDTVSFFIRPGNSPALKIQTATVNGSTGAITWGSDVNVTSSISSLTKDSVYNICLTMNGSGAISVEKVEAYTGNYYIRVDAANSKWDNYRSDPDHLMTYSEYSITHGGYSHYYCHWVDASDSRKNVKFCIANDYSPSISDTLTRETASGDWTNITYYVEDNGDLKRNANVRFMWNRHDNTISRAYVDGAQEDDSRFLVISSTDGKIKKADGSALSNNEVTFQDDENWIYEANVQAQPEALIKLKSTWGTSNTIEQYFKGSSTTTEQLIGGSGENWYDIRILYDFKTNRLIASYIPVDENIESERTLEADIMFIREHQGDIAQLTFGENGKISKIETAYGVMRFNKWTLANKSKEAGHAPLGSPASIYERSLFWISFPFKVKLSEVIGFGSYGEHWAIQRYDGADRATRGHFLENGSFWRWMNRNTEYLEPDQGYLLAIDLDLLGESSDVWGPNSRSEQIEIYFPSFGKMPDITNADVPQTLEAYECTINRAATEGLPDTGDPRTSYNRTIFDSHWHVMSVPTYVNTDDVSFANTTWISQKPSFLYTWNAVDNTITATSASGYTYHAMHAYMVQYEGDITWSASSGSPASIVARRTYAEEPSKVEFRLELQQNEKMIDRTYVALSNDEEVSTGFKFGEDLTKEFNANKSCIYTFIADEATVAGNTLPMSNQTTIVPVGVDIKKNGDYTFSIPDGTSGIGVTLIDNETGIRTSLSALDYTVNLSAGTYDNRFMLEISPIKPVATGIEDSDIRSQKSDVRKVMIDGLLYIVKDGKMFDARGARVQ